jgi:hypothetical protein
VLSYCPASPDVLYSAMPEKVLDWWWEWVGVDKVGRKKE